MMFHQYPPDLLARARAARALLLERRAAVGDRQGRDLGAALVELREASLALQAFAPEVLVDAEGERLAFTYARETELLNAAGARRLRRWADPDRAFRQASRAWFSEGGKGWPT